MDVGGGGSHNPTLHPPPRPGSLSLLSPKGCPQCQRVPKGMSLLPPHPPGCDDPPKGMCQWQSCGIQRDASASGMSSKECPWCHHIPVLHVPPLSPLCDMHPNGHTAGEFLEGCSHCSIDVPNVSPTSCPHNDVSATTVSQNRSPHCWCDRKGMSLLCHRVPKSVHPLFPGVSSKGWPHSCVPSATPEARPQRDVALLCAPSVPKAGCPVE